MRNGFIDSTSVSNCYVHAMVSFNGLMRTIRTTRNFSTALQLRNSGQSKKISFRNGVEAEVTYSQYTLLRDWFDQLQRQSFVIEKTNGAYTIKNAALDYYAPDIVAAKPFFDFLQSLIKLNWAIQRNQDQYSLKRENKTYLLRQTSNALFEVTSEKLKIAGPSASINVLFYECEENLYLNNYHDKTVLDIGGFCGETAAYFAGQGAKKVIIYEPVLANQTFIEKNVALNNINAEIHPQGVGEKDETQTIHYENFDLSFGLSNTGQNQTTINIKNISNVLLKSQADIAKIDCEGAEISLLKVPAEVLGLIDFYFIETHSNEIKEAISHKFNESGFVTARASVNLSVGIDMLYFKKKPN